jgi:transcriptional/translational regulatory protein YebC/TACO1
MSEERLTPVEKGALEAEKQGLTEIAKAGEEVIELLSEPVETEGKSSSFRRKAREPKIERVKREVAEKMQKAGKTPEEIGKAITELVDVFRDNDD